MRRHPAGPTSKVRRPEQAPAHGEPEDASRAAHPLLLLQARVGNRAAGRVAQAKLAVSRPEDPAEREADRVADRIMRTCAPCAAGGPPCPKCRAKNGRVMQRKVEAPDAVPSGMDSSLTDLGAGLPLDGGTRSFFESRFGHDFGAVRVHAGPRAAAAASAVQAVAFTLGRDVVFGAGAYAPGTAPGRQLLAHELAHVVQQGAAPELRTKLPAGEAEPGGAAARTTAAVTPGAYSLRVLVDGGERLIGPPWLGQPAGGLMEAEPAQGEEAQGDGLAPAPVAPVLRVPPARPLIQRKISFTQPTPQPQDPLARLGQGLTPGLTTPTIGGKKIATSQDMLTAVTPTQVSQTGSSGGAVRCQFDRSFAIDTSAEQIVASKAGPSGWTGTLPPAVLGNPAACAKQQSIPTTMVALPSNADFVTRVQASENEHVDEIKTLHNRHLVPYEAFLMGLNGTGPTLQDCGQNLLAQLAHRHQQASFSFVFGYAAATQKLDGPGGTHADTAVPTIAAGCASVTLTVSQTNPKIPGSGPGNVVTVAPTVTTFNPAKLKVVGSEIREGKTVVKKFSNAANAAQGLKVIQHYGMDSRNVIGAMEYFLAGGKAPSGPLPGANEVAIDPAAYQVTLDLPNQGDWAITEVQAIPSGVNINVLVNFGTKRNEAYSAWQVLTSFGFTQRCWVGGTRQAPEMLYFRT